MAEIGNLEEVFSKVFHCPECGGSHFGTSTIDDWSNAKGHCHDEFGVRCRFTWRRETEDPLVFKTIYQHEN
jgi:transcription elongation factor Elf1